MVAPGYSVEALLSDGRDSQLETKGAPIFGLCALEEGSLQGRH